MFRIFLLILLLTAFLSKLGAQENFQKIYLFNDTAAQFSNIYVTDSCYYFGASSGKGVARCDVTFGKLKLNGEVDFYSTFYTPNEFNYVYGGRTQLDTNFRGNFMFGYRNAIYGVWNVPQITEVDINGNVVNDSYIDFFEKDSLATYDLGQIINSNEDSSYYFYFTYSDESIGSNQNGVILGKLKWTGDTLWSRKFYNTQNSYIQFGVGDITYLGNGKLLLSMTEIYKHAPSQAQLDWAKIHFYVTDENGTILNHKVFQDSQKCFGGYGVLSLDDGGVIHSYYDSRLTGEIGDQYFISRPIIARLDENYQMVWKDSLTYGFWNLAFYLTPNRLISVNDTVFAGAYAGSIANFESIDEVTNWSEFRAFHTVRLFNRHINGTRLWERDYVYWNLVDSNNEPMYTLMDFELTTDGGFITCGNVIHVDSANAGKPAQYAYLLKTNCLGFLDDP